MRRGAGRDAGGAGGFASQRGGEGRESGRAPARGRRASDELTLRYRERKMNVGGAFARFGSEVIDGGDDTLGFEMPLDEEAIGGHAAMKRAGGDAIEIGDVAAADGAETVDVEVGVFGFEGIEGPLDETNAATEGVFALEEFYLAADAAVAMGGENGGHVGVEIGSLVVVTADVGLGETDENVAIKGAEDLAAGLIGDDKGGEGLGFKVAFAPDLAGNLDAAVEFVEGMKGPEEDVGVHGRSSRYTLSVFCFACRGRIGEAEEWRAARKSKRENGE